MPTWKQKDAEGKTLYQFLCDACSRNKKELLEKDSWLLVREGEPASCNDCELQCALTAGQLWGAEEAVRFTICESCANFVRCPLQGRYYC